MKIVTSLLILATSAQCCVAFTNAPNCRSRSCASTTARPMGMFDFFSEEAKQERERKAREKEERKEREIEEQMRYQREIMARRENPKKMEEYEEKVRTRRQLRMNGDDEAAEAVEIYSGEDTKIVGLN